MKKIALLILIITCFSIDKPLAQDNLKHESSEYCILRVHGVGWNKDYFGIFIVYEDLNVEKKEFKDRSAIGILKETMENINLLKNRGFTLISSTTSAAPALVNEYIFKKQK